jgi:hypothetical protein
MIDSHDETSNQVEVVRMARAVATLGPFVFYTLLRFHAIQVAARRIVLGMGHCDDPGSLSRKGADARASE